MASLFEPMVIGSMTARNRLIRAATAESLCTRAGEPAAPLLECYGQLAAGGVGTIITGFAYFMEEGKAAERSLNACSDEFGTAFRALVDRAHGCGARIVLQLVYGGSKSRLAAGDSRWLPAAADGPRDGIPTVDVLGPSAVVNPSTSLVPREADASEVEAVADALGRAAGRAKAWGFDGVEVHGAHGYLLSQFLSPRFNRRTDSYGGPIGNRARALCRCVEAARAAVGPDYPVLVKLNSCDDYDDPTGLAGGLSEEDSAEAARLLQEAGASALEISGDWHRASKEAVEGQPYFGAYGARLARVLDIPVIVTGGWRNPRIAEAHLAADGIAGIGLSRPFIREPHLASRWEAQDMAPSLCIGCGICGNFGGIPCPNRV